MICVYIVCAHTNNDDLIIAARTIQSKHLNIDLASLILNGEASSLAAAVPKRAACLGSEAWQTWKALSLLFCLPRLVVVVVLHAYTQIGEENTVETIEQTFDNTLAEKINKQNKQIILL